MVRVVIQTVLDNCEVVLLNDGLLLGMEGWDSNKDEVKKVLPALEMLLKDYGHEWKEIDEIIVVVGKGNFSSTRIGVTIANILSLATGAKIYELEVSGEKNLAKLLNQIDENFKKGWAAVPIAQPIYRSEPMISASKQKKFTE